MVGSYTNGTGAPTSLGGGGEPLPPRKRLPRLSKTTSSSYKTTKEAANWSG